MKLRPNNSPPDLIKSMLNLNDVEPWSGKVDLDALMKECLYTIKSYVVLSEHDALAVVLWIINSWCPKLFARCPLLLINAPERECGKTQLLKVVEKLVSRPIETANISLAALFRLITNYSPTLLIDEADTFMEGKSEMAGVVNKGYERGGVVLRVESSNRGDQIERAFEVFGPKAMAGIMLERHLPSATMSRGIQIPLKRKTKDDTVLRLRAADPKVFASLRSRILKFVLENRDVLSKGWEELPGELSDRQQDNWESLLAIANCFGEVWYAKAVEAALQNCAETSPPKSSSNQLLEDIREVLDNYEEKYIPSVDLLAKLNDDQDMDWSNYNRGQPLTARQLARFMGAYGIKPKTVRIKSGQTPKGYEVREFEDAFVRYLPERLEEPVEKKLTPPPGWKSLSPNF